MPWPWKPAALALTALTLALASACDQAGFSSPITPPTAAPAAGSAGTSASSGSTGQVVGGSLAATPAVSAADNATPQATGWLLYAREGDLWETGPGSSAVQLTQQGNLSQPAITASGVFYVARTRNASDVWLAGATGVPQPLTHDQSAVISQNHWATEPVPIPLPGASRLYVLADQDKSATGVGDLAIWELDQGAGQMVQITHPPAYTGGDQDVAPNPRDPRQIIFTRYDYAGTNLTEQLEWLDVVQGTAVALTQPGQSSRQAAIAPGGDTLAYVQTDGQNENLYLAGFSVTGGKPQLTNPQQAATGMIAEPSWSPDGSQIAYIARTDKAFQIWTVAVSRGADGSLSAGQPRQVTHDAGVDATARPVWLTDSQATSVRHWLSASGA